MHEVYFGDSKDIYGAGFKTARIPLRLGARARPSTFYQRYGDWFGWACLALSGLWLVRRKLAQRRRQPARAAAED
jgi:apolipoprotein N-acyltransferase